MKTVNIVIADDNDHVRGALSSLLEDEGYTLWLAKNGMEALQLVREVSPDILFLDIMMPKINGHDVCRIIKNSPDLKKTYIIILTAAQELAKEVCADEHITKPFNPPEILSRIKQILKR